MLAEPNRPWRRRFAPRALLILLGVPVVAFIVDVTVPVIGVPATTVAVRILLFTAATLGFLRCIALRAGRKRHDLRDAAILFAGVCFGAPTCIPIPSLPAPTLIILIAGMTAIVEEYIFRRRLPEVLKELLNHSVPSRSAWAVSVLAAQVAFATCHFVTAGHLQPLGNGLPILRIFAAGCFLAVIVSYAGMATAVLVHATTNVLVQTSIAGRLEAPTDGVVVACSGLAIACVIAAGLVQQAQGRPQSRSPIEARR